MHGKKWRVYLDNCCYNRPYDDQEQERIALESQAKLKIQAAIREGVLELATSYMTAYENDKNPYEMRRNNIQTFQERYATAHVIDTADGKILDMAREIEATGVKHKDACHVACAILSQCDFFLTTDDRLLKYRSDAIKLENPIDFQERMEGIGHGNERS